MSTRVLKVLFLQSLFVLSLLLSACGEGDRGFVPLPEEEVEEEILPIVLKASGVKGPLVNAEIGLYKLNLNEGLIKQHGDASEAFFRLLEEADVIINDNNVVEVEPDPLEFQTIALGFIQARVQQLVYVTELPRLQYDIENTTSTEEARVILDVYLSDDDSARETNTKPKAAVQNIYSGFTTLAELKTKISDLKPFETQLSELTSLSSAESLITVYSASEADDEKIKDWAAFQNTFTLVFQTIALDFIQNRVKQLGYVTELPRLQYDIENTISTEEARVILDVYLGDDDAARETNTKPKAEVQNIYSNFATLAELKTKISDIEPFEAQLSKLTSLSSAENLIGSFRASEGDVTKIIGWEAIQNNFKITVTSLSVFRESLKATVSSLTENNKLETDLIALNRLINLEEDINSAPSVTAAEELLAQAITEEGNKVVREALATLQTSIISFEDFVSQSQMDNALYHFSDLQENILNADSSQNGSLQTMFDNSIATLSRELEPSLRDAFKNKELHSVDGVPTNQIKSGLSNEFTLLSGINLDEYSGFVYMDVNSIDNTVDLNSGKMPIISEFYSVFHTDIIRGYGNNTKENRTLYYLKNGQEQRDTQGALITDIGQLKVKSGDELLQIQPHRFATPLTKLAVELMIERFKSFKPQLSDVDGDGVFEYRITASALKSELKVASNDVIETFGVGLSKDQSIFDMPAVLTLPMQYSTTDQEVSMLYRATVESFSAFISALKKETNLSTDLLFDAVVLDFLDGEIDGYIGDEVISEFSKVSDVSYLVKRSPSEVLIPGSSKTVDEIVELMASQVSIIEPRFVSDTLDIDASELSSPVGGIDSDGDGILDNSDFYPDDATKDNNIEVGYSGVWNLEVDNSHNFIMPLSGEFTFGIDRYTEAFDIATICIAAAQPCLSEGIQGSPLLHSWELIRSPEAGNFEITEIFTTAGTDTTDGQVGFKATASIPGVYQVRATLIAQVVPFQTFSFIVPVKVIDPQSIVIQFNPEAPNIGEAVAVEFQATDDLCRVYTFCDSNDVGSYFDISYLSEFNVSWDINGGESQEYKSLSSKSETIDIISTNKDDTLNIAVVFSSGSVEFVAADDSVSVGTSTDSDGDGVTDEDDAYPSNEFCSREADGFKNEDKEEFCNHTFINDELTRTNDLAPLEIKFEGSSESEIWSYDESWDRVFRSKTEYIPVGETDEGGIDYEINAQTKFFESIKLPKETGSGVSKVISNLKSFVDEGAVDEESRRVYIVYTDGSIDYFSFDDKKLHAFTDSNITESNEVIPVKSISPTGLVVLVEYKQGVNPSEYKLFQRSGEISIIESNPKYPKPGLPVNLTIDGNDIFEFAQSFKPKWTLTRLVEGQPTEIPISESDDSLILLAGQTLYGDILSVSFEDDKGVAVSTISIAVLDTLRFGLNKRSYSDTDAITVLSPGFDLNTSNAEKFIKVKWLKYDSGVKKEKFQSYDLAFPFSYSATNTNFGDIITAQIYLENGIEGEDGEVGLFLESYTAVIIGDPALQFNVALSEPDFNAGTKVFSVKVTSPTVDEKYFDEYFDVVWKVDGEIVPDENSLDFPSSLDTEIKFGSTLTVSFDFELDSYVGSTPDLGVFTFDFDPSISSYSLTPLVPEAGQDISLDFDGYTELSLSRFVPQWFINGALDDDAAEFTYSGENLKYGDHVRLKIEEIDDNLDDGIDPPAFAHEAEIYVGVNIFESEVADSINDDKDDKFNKDDYFRFDSACYAESDGNPDDADGDGLSDLSEMKGLNRTNPNDDDSDDDGLSDFDEQVAGTDPNNADTDNDGFKDGLEVNQLSTDPLDDQVPASAEDDLDRDGVLNEDELAAGTFVNQVDSDNDGLFDGMEKTKGTDPLNPDTDGDGLSDGIEVYVTKTDPIGVEGNADGKDSDDDGLSDGVEVRLLGFNPKDTDTDDDGIPDADEESVIGVGELPAGEVINIGDLNDYAYEETTSIVPTGTCYSTWLGQQNIENIVASHELQVNEGSAQQVSFSNDEWSEILRYDAKNTAFLPPLTQDLIKGNVTAIEYDVSNINIQYFGYLNGQIREYNEDERKKVEETGKVYVLANRFDVGDNKRIQHIIDQGKFLLVETIDEDSGSYTHYLFDKAKDNDNKTIETAPIDTFISSVSYKSSVWRNNASTATRTELILLGDEPTDTSLIKETINVANPLNLSQLSQTVLKSTVGVTLVGPIFIESLDADALNFGSGDILNLTTNEWLEGSLEPSDPPVAITIPAFEHGFQHNSLRITVPQNTSQVQLNLQTELVSKNQWLTVQQLENDHVLRILPLGTGALAISHGTNGITQLSNQPPLAFETIISGDFDGDGLTDQQEITITFTDPGNANSDNEFEDDGSFVRDGDEDSDGDGLSDSVELSMSLSQTPTQTDIISADPNDDFDGDGLSNLIEVTQTQTNPSLMDSDFDGINDGDEDFDEDGLTNLQELNITNTDITAEDSNGDGVVDGDEQSDNDGLSDSIELNQTQTEFNNDDTDGNGTSDADEDFDQDGLSNIIEVIQTLTNPSLVDTDGNGADDGDEDRDDDGLTNLQELNDTLTTLNVADTDSDGITDGDEDSDNDSLSDAQELRATLTNFQLIDSDSNGTIDGDEDRDNDGLSDSIELNLTLTLFDNDDSDSDSVKDPNEDLDNDQLNNLIETTQTFTNPLLTDSDGNGVNDGDEDSDGDGLTNLQEVSVTLTNPSLIDSDTNGTNDGDEDTDNDGLSDKIELNSSLTDISLTDTNSDGINDGDEDSDQDGISNIEEVTITLTDPGLVDTDGNGVNDGSEDNDSDGLSNYQELSITNTNPAQADSNNNGTIDGNEDRDNDGLSDSIELNQTQTNFNDTDSNSDSELDINEDNDLDGLSNVDELQLTLTNPGLYDTDGDGISDGDEDKDIDGLSDSIELNQTLTNISIIDTDGNGTNDGDEDLDLDGLTNVQELNLTLTEIDNIDTDGNGTNDGDEDTDQDGLSNITEVNLTLTNPLLIDTDGNGINDGDEDRDLDKLTDLQELTITLTDFSVNDSDGDGVIDGDEDRDNDGLSDYYEINVLATSFDNVDSDSNGTNDGDEDADQDGLSNLIEISQSLTNPSVVDTDQNGVNDGAEDLDQDGLTNIQELTVTLTNIDSLDTNANGINDGDEDRDNDGLSDQVELNLTHTQFDNIDSDGNGTNDGDEDVDQDGLSNLIELTQTLTNPSVVDTDQDGVNDGAEDLDQDGLTNAQELNVTLSDVDNLDTDGNGVNDGDEDRDDDGLSDYVELNLTQTQFDNIDSDGNGTNDGEEDFNQDGLSNLLDFDQDGLLNLIEQTQTLTDSALVDTDGNGINDGNEDTDQDGLLNLIEQNQTLTNSALVDTDSDGINDGGEDLDQDGLTNKHELSITLTEVDNLDTDGDGINDGDEDRDGDGLFDRVELNFTQTQFDKIDSDDNGVDDGAEDFNQDGLSNLLDYDQDGLLNLIEQNQTLTSPVLVDTDENGTNDGDEDQDQDGLSNLIEQNQTLTNPALVDTDNNGTNDGDEDKDQDGLSNLIELTQTLTNPALADTDNNGINDGDEDKDQDGLSNIIELTQTLTSPILDDTDDNGIKDGDEDRDGDGLSDAVEFNQTKTNFNNSDTDANGINDIDEDSDQDGLSNLIELTQTLTNPGAPNTDGEGAGDEGEDLDQDGLTNLQELTITLTDMETSDTDGNGTIDGDEDRDNDGLSDSIELNITQTSFNDSDSDGNGINDGDEDFDNDGLSNLQELNITLTALGSIDTDGDGINDGDEDLDGDGLTDAQELTITLTDLTVLDSDSNGINDGNEDRDNDGLSDSIELNITHTSFNDNAAGDGNNDFDNDGLSNLIELNKTLTDLALIDTDGNGINDGDEDTDDDGLTNIQEVVNTNTEPHIPDTDGNGTGDGQEDSDGDNLSDATELNLTGTDFDNIDTDGNGVNDGSDSFDSDGDRLSDIFEEFLGTCVNSTQCSNPQDSDDDGLSDFDEVLVNGTNPLLDDTDGDGISDFIEVRSGLSDPTSSDGDSDGLSDALELGLDSDPDKPLFRSNPLLKDSDYDGANDLDEFEFEYFYSEVELEEFGLDEPNIMSSPLLKDSDNDGLSDRDEMFIYQTNPGLSDTDNDGLSDYDELNLDNGSITSAGARDSDGDGLSDGQEVLVTLTDPNDTDSDDNGIVDGDEDRDQDGLTDSEELNLSLTDFDNSDTDGDGIIDPFDDEDSDSLNNKDEIKRGTDTHLEDTDGDGITDDQEFEFSNPTNPDSDNDGLNDGEELALGTDPLVFDTDKDGLGDGEEVMLRSNPLDIDTDHDFLIDGIDINIGLLTWDSDLDGIPDGIEKSYLNTDPENSDTDGDGLLDAEEAWVYAITEDGEIKLVGLDNNQVKLNSRDGNVGFNAISFADNGKDRQVVDLKSVLYLGQDQSEQVTVATLYIKRVSRPDTIDTDGDGLTDDIELKEIEFTFGNHFDPNNIGGNNSYDPNKPNTESFFVSDPWELDTADINGVKNMINDGDEDIDGDFYTNVLEQSTAGSSVINPHSDISDDGVGDSLLDGIEVLLLLSKPDFVDSDEDGLSDAEELNGLIDPALKDGPVTCRVENADSRVSCFNVPSGLAETVNPCTSTEIKLPDVAGVTYCFNVDFESFPNRKDSDSDGVLDPDDFFKLDPSCSILADGFTEINTNKKQCFSSWMASQSDIEQIQYTQWKDDLLTDQSQIAFYSEGWDKVVRFDNLSAQYLPLIKNEAGTEQLKIAYSPSNQRLYLADEYGLIKYLDLVSGAELKLISGVVDPDTDLDAIIVAGTSLIVQLKGATEYTHKIYNASGQEVVTSLSGSEDFNLSDAFWDQEGLRLYGFKQAVGQPVTNLGFVNILNNQFNGPIVYSSSLGSEGVISGPIALSQDRKSIYLGSGQKRLAGLGVGDDIDPKVLKGNSYSSFHELMELSDHFVSLIDAPSEDSPINPNTRNGLFIEDISDLSSPDFANSSYLFTARENEKILKLVPFINNGDSEVIFVSRDESAISFGRLGLLDKDGDGMTGIYEDFYELNDNDASDRFTDPDGDSLTNIEEYQYATDPLNEDTDGDSWDDAYEVINETDPLDAEIF